MNKRTGFFRLDGLLWGATAACVVAVLAGCGGGLQLGIGTNRNDPPTVTLASVAASGVRGGKLTLVADANDDSAVSRVVFYRVVNGGDPFPEGSDSGPPYFFEVTLPLANVNSATTVSYFARAVDNDDESTDSASVNVTLEAPKN